MEKQINYMEAICLAMDERNEFFERSEIPVKCEVIDYCTDREKYPAEEVFLAALGMNFMALNEGIIWLSNDRVFPTEKKQAKAEKVRKPVSMEELRQSLAKLPELYAAYGFNSKNMPAWIVSDEVSDRYYELLAAGFGKYRLPLEGYADKLAEGVLWNDALTEEHILAYQEILATECDKHIFRLVLGILDFCHDACGPSLEQAAAEGLIAPEVMRIYKDHLQAELEYTVWKRGVEIGLYKDEGDGKMR